MNITEKITEYRNLWKDLILLGKRRVTKNTQGEINRKHEELTEKIIDTEAEVIEYVQALEKRKEHLEGLVLDQISESSFELSDEQLTVLNKLAMYEGAEWGEAVDRLLRLRNYRHVYCDEFITQIDIELKHHYDAFIEDYEFVEERYQPTSPAKVISVEPKNRNQHLGI